MNPMDQNIAAKLRRRACEMPDRMAVAEPLGRDRTGKRLYREITFRQLDDDSTRVAQGLVGLGARPGQRLVLMVRPGIDFISLVFALFKSGVVTVLIDPGMGRSNLVQCLHEVEAEGFVAIPVVQAVRTLLRQKFRQARLNVTVGRRWFWGGVTLQHLRKQTPASVDMPSVASEDPAAIIFTTGSTGPPKGVLYRHRNFSEQAEQIQQHYQIEPGGIDLPGFPLFGLFNCAMGTSTVIPVMDPTRPAEVDPRNIIEPIHEWEITQAFGSPALWNVVGRHCHEHGVELPTMRRVLSAGAPVPPDVLDRMKSVIHPDGDVHTPYGATEALPVASIAASSVLARTAILTRQGKGTCVGNRFSGIRWRVIRIRDDAVADISEVEALPTGEIGELIVQGPVVTTEYVTRRDANALHKIQDGDSFWHRMGDVGYLDEQDQFWFCGRKAHRVETTDGTLYTVPCEAIFNEHPDLHRTALVGIGAPGQQIPAIIVEPLPGHRPRSTDDERRLFGQLREMAVEYPHTACIKHFAVCAAMPVDIRHNAKISREKLAKWGASRIQLSTST
jgi:acyl-CoA synthetase (AMP-forming)/AMP-acid ligase II